MTPATAVKAATLCDVNNSKDDIISKTASKKGLSATNNIKIRDAYNNKVPATAGMSWQQREPATAVMPAIAVMPATEMT